MKAKALALLVTGGFASRIDLVFMIGIVCAVIIAGLLEIFFGRNDR